MELLVRPTRFSSNPMFLILRIWHSRAMLGMPLLHLYTKLLLPSPHPVTAQALVLNPSVTCLGFIVFGFVALCSWRCVCCVLHRSDGGAARLLLHSLY